MRSVRQYFDLSLYIIVSGVDYISTWCQYGYVVSVRIRGVSTDTWCQYGYANYACISL